MVLQVKPRSIYVSASPPVGTGRRCQAKLASFLIRECENSSEWTKQGFKSCLCLTLHPETLSLPLHARKMPNQPQICCNVIVSQFWGIKKLDKWKEPFLQCQCITELQHTRLTRQTENPGCPRTVLSPLLPPRRHPTRLCASPALPRVMQRQRPGVLSRGSAGRSLSHFPASPQHPVARHGSGAACSGLRMGLRQPCWGALSSWFVCLVCLLCRTKETPLNSHISYHFHMFKSIPPPFRWVLKPPCGWQFLEEDRSFPKAELNLK